MEGAQRNLFNFLTKQFPELDDAVRAEIAEQISDEFIIYTRETKD